MARGLAGSSHTRGYLNPVLVSLARHALQTLFPLPGCPSCPPGRLGPARPSGPLGRRFPRIDRPTSQSTLTPQVQSSPSSAGPEDAFLSLPPPRQGRTTLPCDAPTASGARAPSPAAVVRPAPGRAPETRGGIQGALQGVEQSVPRTAVANDHTLSVRDSTNGQSYGRGGQKS